VSALQAHCLVDDRSDILNENRPTGIKTIKSEGRWDKELSWIALLDDWLRTIATDFAEGLMGEWSPASAVRFYGKGDPLAEYLDFCFLPNENALEKVSLPAMSPSPVIWILVSDSSCALITGPSKCFEENHCQDMPR
jgi:hypothetical protein